ncbi:glycine--tRNA ligase subunit beta [Thalassotalea sp. HSM 43]|uniref:glycine--tRNA ligase subunit beta n=1 Tax=Thalassotalea sp. HSM 43 TaxID=2552945 RepID=UPI001080A6DC|nr:glycine--tRNA ligase subunit beta [Thalassotalea sp. HSM 43]QBY04424.1 glycine--tRNA ligase subunit beta [Thalassotalea sp. HSM 43]
MSKDTLLVELGTEELPPKALKGLAQAFFDSITEQLQGAGLGYAKAKWFATPRRLAVQVTELEQQQQDKVVEKRGPAVNVAFDADGNATKAAQGWARSNGITVEQAERLVTDKGEWLLHKATQQGKSIAQLLEGMVSTAVNKLPIPKPMRWGSSRIQFIRPVHTITMMFGADVISGNILGVASDNQLLGHRFHFEGMVTLDHANNYEQALKSAYVIADYETRRSQIVDDVNAAAAELNGKALLDDELVDEVASINEWPSILVGSFDEDFLQVPAEPLIYSMKDHQKYFPVEDSNGALLNKFIFVTNIESKQPEQVIHGNEKVIRPRLADAEFFFKTDKKQSLESRLQSLSTVLFQKQLGTLKDKSERIATLAKFVAESLSENADNAYRAGLLSKTDLMSEMVLEFPQVQGTMGKYYAQHDGEPADVAQALEDQYRPRFAGDSLPEANVGAAVAIADKVDSLVGIFGINQPPKGDKDPFALRRAAIGLIRIIIEKQLPLDIADLINVSIDSYGDKLTNDNTAADVIDFIMGRFRAYYQEQGIKVDVIQAVLAKTPTAPLDFDQRVKAVSYFRELEQAQALAAANKRVGNILAKFDGELYNEFDNALASEPQEIALAETFAALQGELQPLFANRDYQQALTKLAGLRGVIDEFFDNVMVMADDEKVKTNRLTLLNQIRNSFFNVADISVLQ